MAQLGKYIKRRREQRGWSRLDLQRESGVPHTTIRNIEVSDHNVKAEERTIEALAAAFTEDPAVMKVLAGYKVPANGTVGTLAQQLDALMQSSPEWKDVLERISTEFTADEQQQALTALQIHAEQVRRRRQQN